MNIATTHYSKFYHQQVHRKPKKNKKHLRHISEAYLDLFCLF